MGLAELRFRTFTYFDELNGVASPRVNSYVFATLHFTYTYMGFSTIDKVTYRLAFHD